MDKKKRDLVLRREWRWKTRPDSSEMLVLLVRLDEGDFELHCDDGLFDGGQAQKQEREGRTASVLRDRAQPEISGATHARRAPCCHAATLCTQQCC